MSNFYEQIKTLEQKLHEEKVQAQKNETEKHLAEAQAYQQRLINELAEAKRKFYAAIAALESSLYASQQTSHPLDTPIRALIRQSKLIVDAKKYHRSVNRIDELTHIAHWVNSALNNQPMQDEKTLEILRKEINRSSFLDKRNMRIITGIGLAITTIILALYIAPFLWHVGAILSVNTLAETRCLLGMGFYFSAVGAYCGAAISAIFSIHTGLFAKPGSVGSEVKTMAQFFKPKEASHGYNQVCADNPWPEIKPKEVLSTSPVNMI